MAAPRSRQPSRARRPAGGLPVGTEPSRGGGELQKHKTRDKMFRFQATSGFCATREGSTKPDLAYSLKNKAVISVPTATVFPGIYNLALYDTICVARPPKIFFFQELSCNNSSSDGFPYDFSILAAFRTPSSPNKGQLFTAYSADGSLILSVKVRDSV